MTTQELGVSALKFARSKMYRARGQAVPQIIGSFVGLEPNTCYPGRGPKRDI
jgi:hypothetical protein